MQGLAKKAMVLAVMAVVFMVVSQGAFAQAPYGGTNWAIPGKIEAENYDDGGEGDAYHDTDAGNTGSAYRSDDVDIQTCTDTGGGYNIGWTANDEWLEYTVNVATAGEYFLQARVASPNSGKAFHVEFGGVDVTGAVAVPNTGAWGNWTTVTKRVTLSAGVQIMGFYFNTGDFNLNYLNITQASTPYLGTLFALPCKIELEYYDLGGQNVAYYDRNNTQQGQTVFRTTEGADVSFDDGGMVICWWRASDEWMNYSINIPTAGAYAIRARYKTSSAVNGNTKVEFISFNGTTVTVGTGGIWALPASTTSYTTSAYTQVTLPAGEALMRVTCNSDLMFPNYFEIVKIPDMSELYPLDGACGISPDVTLSWPAGVFAVYFGDEYAAVASADVNDTTGIFKGMQSSNSYTPGTLQDGKTYYWRIDQYSDSNSLSPFWTGPVCSFTVGLAKYRFFGSMSRNVTDSYLSHAITQTDFCNPSSLADFNEDKRMLKNISAKFIARASSTWNVPASPTNSMMADYEGYFVKIGGYADMMLAEDEEMLLQGTIYEIVQKSTDSSGTLIRAGVDQVAVPAWVFQAFGQPVVTRNFIYENMLFTNGSYVNHWGNNASVPDISRLETKMYFYYRAVRYMEAGFESIHFGQINLMDDNDAGHVNTIDLFDRIRAYAAQYARRGFILLDSHAANGGIVENGELLFDVGLFPARPKEVCGTPYEAILEMNFRSSIYGKTVAGTTPSGWYCDHVPYNVEIDNYGAYQPGTCHYALYDYVWGWDEACWFAHCSNTYRNNWLGYAVGWLKTNDKVGYLRPNGRRTIAADPFDVNGDGSIDWDYRANTVSAACPAGFGQEETIKALWVDIDKPAAPTGLTATAGNNQVVLDWANNTEFDLASYNVYRSTVSGSYGTPLAVGVTISGYTDSTAVNNTTYYYVVTAVDAFGEESAKSSQVSATPGLAAPTFVAAGAVASGTGTITPALPSGIASGDILLLFLETSNQAVSISNQNGGTWTAVTNSPQYCGTAASTTGARLTAFWSRYNGTQGAPTASDSGDHQLGRIIAIRGAVSSGNPWDVTAGGVEAVSDTSGSIAGATTTVNNTLVVVAIATSLPDASSTAKFSGWTNANLTSLTERTDNSVTAGNGGGLGIATGLKATAGAYGNTAVTLANAAYKGMMSIAIRP